MDETEVFILIAEGENERLDFKRELKLDTARAKAEFIKDAISLANSAPGVGYLLVGIDDAKIIVGSAELPEEQIQNICATYITPPISLHCYSVPVSLPVLPLVNVLEIRASRRPHRMARDLEHLHKEEAYVRHGSVVARATPDEIIRMDDGWLKTAERNRQHLRIAESNRRLGNWLGAIDEYSKVIDTEPTPEVYLWRGEAYEAAYWTHSKNQESWKLRNAAYQDYCHAVDLSESESLERRARIRRLLLDRGGVSDEKWEADLAWLKSNSEGHGLGEVIIAEQRAYYNRTHEAFPDYVEAASQAIELGYNSSEAYFFRALGFMGQFNYGLALIDIDEAIHRSKPGDNVSLAEYIARKIEILMSMERFGEAYKILRELEKTDLREASEMASFMGNQSRTYLLRSALQAHFADQKEHWFSDTLVEMTASKVLALGLNPFRLSDDYNQCPEMKDLVYDIVGADFARLLEHDFPRYWVDIHAEGLTERTEIPRIWPRFKNMDRLR